MNLPCYLPSLPKFRATLCLLLNQLLHLQVLVRADQVYKCTDDDMRDDLAQLDVVVVRENSSNTNKIALRCFQDCC